MKYVIWGCGFRGKTVINILKEKRVAAFVDSNEELHGSTYCGIPIISFDEFLLSYSAYPVIVASRFFEDEIMEQLKLNNIIGAFTFSREWAQIECLLVQLPIVQTIKRYKVSENLAIYGVSLLGLILYDLLLENGFEVSLVLPNSTGFSLKKYVSETLKLKTMSVDDVKKNNMILLLSTELEESDQSKLHGITYDKYYDLYLQKELFYNPELEHFKNIHMGKRCFIVATGSSLRMDDLDTLYNNGEICFSVNRIYKAFDKTKWRPDYYVIVDPHIDIDELLRMDVQTKFIADCIAYSGDKHYGNIYRWHHIKKMYDSGLPDFSDDFARGGYWGHTIVYDGALQLAVYMGFKEIYLLGTDCTVSPDGITPHFVPDYSEFSSGLALDKIMPAYQVAKQYADSHGIKIFNATRGGNLEVFPRVDFDTLFIAGNKKV